MGWTYNYPNSLKIASIKLADDNDTSSDVPYLKEEFQFEIADVDRYATDKYFANLTLQETEKRYSIGFQMYNYQVGITGSVQYWHFDKSKLKQAKKTYKEAKNALTKIMKEIEYHRPPMAVITPMIRKVLQPIGLEHKERSGNYFYNWFEELPKEGDWRQTLYGERYPDPSIQSIGQFWRVDEKGKAIVTEGNNSRRRVLRYKQASVQKNAAFDDLVTKWKNFAIGFGIPLTVGLGALIFNNPQILEQKQQENPSASPQQVIQEALQEQPQPQSVPEFINNSDNFQDNIDLPPKQDSIDYPRGIRNNNPGNIDRNKTVWEGMAGEQSDTRFITFESPEYGIRAMARIIRNYERKYKLRTIEQIVSRWAPPSENNTNAYIQNVSRHLNISPQSPLNLNDNALLGQLIKAIIQHENGGDYYSDQVIQRGIELEKQGSSKRVYHYAYQDRETPLKLPLASSTDEWSYTYNAN